MATPSDGLARRSVTLDSPSAAKLLNCSTAHLHRLARSGVIPGAKVGRGWVFIEQDLLDWLRQQTKPKPAPRPVGRPRLRTVQFPT